MPRAQPLHTSVRGALDRWLFHLKVPETAPIRLTQRRIYVLPTSAGFGLAAALLAMLVASINYSLSLGFGLTFLIAGVAVASIVHAFRNLFGLGVQPGRCAPVFCGDDARFVLRIANPRAARRPALRLRALGGRTDFELAASDTATVELACPTTLRGTLPAGRTILETTWPLGLIRAWSVFVPDLDCIVYPKPEADAPPLPAGSPGGGSGHREAGEGDDDFHGLRPYRDSDSPRHVAWKALARGAPMLTKQYTGLGGGDVLLGWNDLPPALDDEARLSRLTAWILAAERTGRRYALRLPGTYLDAGQGDAHLHRCLRALTAHRPHAGPQVDARLDAR
ncbi:hypothetical protein CCZ27_04930 [Thauera sinica]|nr:DUF58 domain-containing protein [Thauera sp. K11]ATE62480.1 hypothetical protein CCZ27_04930 [Thauera sp. K11]